MSSPTGFAKRFPLKSRTVQATYQLSATLGTKHFPDTHKRFEEARSLTLWWMNRRLKRELGRGIPPSAWEGQSFEIDQHGQLYAAIFLPDLNLWTCRLEHDDPAVPARTWSVDLALRQVDSDVIIVERALCVSPSTCNQPVPLNVQRIIRDLISKIGLNDVVPITAHPWYLEASSDLETLELILSDTSRLLPVVMLTEADGSEAKRTYKASRFVLDPEVLGSELVGLAHVVVMPRQLGFEWTNRMGKAWSAFNGAVRTFRPGLSFSNDDPYRHPLAKLDDIVLWEYEDALNTKTLRSEPAFQAFLKQKMFQTITSRPLRHEDTLFYRYAKVRSLSSGTTTHLNVSPLEEELRLEVAELRKQLDEERGEKDYVYAYSAELEENLQRVEKERFNLRAQLEVLRAGLGQAVREHIPLPASLEELDDWQRHVAGQLWIAPRAIAATRKSEFRDPTLVFESLLLLANEYRQMRIGGGKDLQAAYESGLKRLKLTEARSISDSRAGEQGDQYFVNHPFVANKPILLESHLRQGTDRDPRNCLRIYFTWERQEQLVIVGWLPSHLTTRNT
ncbi:MAG: hypothetical protein NTY38_04555 [Acidobacteria bacterium]|nr:hypothetical protein [Acidobacteriota bacterium]